MENKTPNPNPIKPNSKVPKFNISWIYGIIIFTLMGLFFFGENTPSKEVPFTTFKDYVKQGMIEKVDVYSSKNGIEAQLVDYTKAPVDTVFLQRAFGNNYKSFIFNAKALKDSLTKKDNRTLKSVYGEKYETFAKDRKITVSVPAEEVSRFLQSADEK